MQVRPISNYSIGTNTNFTGYNFKPAECMPVSLNPVKNVTNILLKKTAILSNRYQYPLDKALADYTVPVSIPHTKKHLPTEAWEIKKGDEKKYVIVLHGLSHNITNLQDLYKGIIGNTDYAVLAPEYTDICHPHDNRKTFSKKAILDDSKAIINYLDKKGIARKDIVVAGHSFGGYIASVMAKEFPDIGKVILISPTESFKNSFDYEKKSHTFIPNRDYAASSLKALLPLIFNRNIFC